MGYSRHRSDLVGFGISVSSPSYSLIITYYRQMSRVFLNTFPIFIGSRPLAFRPSILHRRGSELWSP